MDSKSRRIAVWLTVDEADELLMRCLSSEGEDSELFEQALNRIADAVREACRDDIAPAAPQTISLPRAA
jgi:hypothetical protein